MHRPTLLKLIHRHLPLCTETNRYATYNTATCKCCGNQDETHDHLFKCPQPELHKSRRSFLQSLRKKCDALNTEPRLRDTLIDNLDELFGNPLSLPSAHHDEVEDRQTLLGWDQVIQGRLSKSWAIVQNEYLTKTNRKSIINNGESWTRAIIAHIWDWFITYWRLRNEITHGQTKSIQAMRIRERTIRELKALYNLKDQVLAVDRNWFCKDADTHADNTRTSTLRSWINTWKPAIVSSIKHAKAWAVQGVHTIPHYFTLQPD